ncbi:N-acetylmuramoyl-L-alanine amidase family protein [Metabacillus iocasae]|uniref:N-acetylmuramoyl-L-alanine amidase n=1 Tax=Priestia iocasae TaxID=2291674 RepID=A0ABS2QY24_9BACI|nr:N-acetylmuramoyl-L-alanine amidase [Metabacillus iocasae]MBM7703882.1 N-acetylmuramoyl-L-alanine amidase [Metabacillus iocasae]
MKKSKMFVASMFCVSLLCGATTTMAEKKESGPVIADEPMWNVAPPPTNYNPILKEQLDKENAQDKNTFRVAANPIIVLDPGHGGTDPGAVGNGIKEKDIVLDIAKRSRDYLIANYPATVYMTRSTDTTVSLESRTAYANSVGANFFVSMHINSYSTSTPNGLETYHYYGSTNGSRLATSTYNKLKSSYSTLRGVKEAGFYVLKYTNMPATLGETGFISNATDAANLATTTFRQNLATQYAQGMHEYWWGF